MEKSFSELIDHFRSKSKQFSETADSLEREALELGYLTGTKRLERPGDADARGSIDIVTKAYAPRKLGRIPRSFGIPRGEVTVENLKNYLEIKKARIRDLALHFQVTEQTIREIINIRSNGIVIGERGWLGSDKKSQA